MSDGPLAGLRVVELPSVGPVPFAAMMLGDLGADVVRVDRVGTVGRAPDGAVGQIYAGLDDIGRNRRRIAVDLADARGVDAVLEIIDGVDVLLEGARPGVAERQGLGPDVCLRRNARLVYGRMTGWGRTGPLAASAGHDINYLALSGALDTIGSAGGPPVAPLGMLGDFGGGAMLLAFGVLAALWERQSSGRGQVVDTAMVDGITLLGTVSRYLASHGESGPRGTNELDGGHPTYGVYETRDRRWLALGAVEPRFRREVLRALGFEETGAEPRSSWAALRARIAGVIASSNLDEWVDRFADLDVCVTPVLTWEQARQHPQQVARHAYVDVDGVTQAAPAPRFSRTPTDRPRAAGAVGADTREVLTAAGLSADRVDALIADGVVADG